MADPNASPVAGDSPVPTSGGDLTPDQDIGSLKTQLSSIDDQYSQPIQKEQQIAYADEDKAVQYANQGADEAERAAKDATEMDPKMQAWLDKTPTKQAAYATAMHAAPVLAILTALGGRMTKLTGGQLLSATTGIVNGMNAGAEAQYTDSYNAWMAAYQKMSEQHKNLMQAHSLMLEAYQGRADAYQKAAEAARRQTGDLLDQKQKKISETIDLFKAQSEAQNRLDRVAIALKSLHERQQQGQSNGLPPGFSQSDIDYYARQQLAGDSSWRSGLGRTKGGGAIIAAVDARVPQLAQEHGISPEGASTTRDERHSIAKALDDRQKYVAAGSQFVANFQKQANLVEKYLDKGTGGATPVFNRWIQAGRKQVEGDVEVNQLDTAIRGLAREHQRIVTGVTSNGQLHASAQETADELLNKDQSAKQIRGTLKVMREEADNALQSGKDEVKSLRTQLSHIGVAATPDGGGGGDVSAGTRTIVRTGTDKNGQRVVQYSDGTIAPLQ